MATKIISGDFTCLIEDRWDNIQDDVKIYDQSHIDGETVWGSLDENNQASGTISNGFVWEAKELWNPSEGIENIKTIK